MIKDIKNKLNQQNNPDMPLFIWKLGETVLDDVNYLNSNSVFITGKAMPEFANLAWSSFILQLETYFKNKQTKIAERPKFTVTFDLHFYNTSSSRFITMIFDILQSNWSKCDCIVNWYYDEEEKDESDGEMYRDSSLYRKVKINLIQR